MPEYSAFGISVNFDDDQFRNAVKFAMELGMNPDETRRPIFVKRSTTRTYWKDGVQLTTAPRTDRDGRPLDPDIEVRRDADQEISVDCAVEVTEVSQADLPVGNFRPNRLTVTLLDVDYVQVKDCREVIYNGDRYAFTNEPESEGLFSVGVYTMVFYAIDES